MRVPKLILSFIALVVSSTLPAQAQSIQELFYPPLQQEFNSAIGEPMPSSYVGVCASPSRTNEGKLRKRLDSAWDHCAERAGMSTEVRMIRFDNIRHRRIVAATRWRYK